MQKLICLGAVCFILAACHCQQTCTVCTTAPVSENSSVVQTEKSPALPTAQKAVANSSAQAGLPTHTAPGVTAAPTHVNTPVAQTPVSTLQEPAFTTAQADTLIARARQDQALAHPPADTLVFKKEGTIPLEGRLLSPLAYQPVQKDTTHAPWSRESLKYGLYYSFIKAGTAYIKTRGITEYKGKQAYLIQTTAFSASVIDSVFKVRDINYSWLDVESLHSLGYSQSLREGNYVRDEWVSFDPANHRYYGQIQKKKEPRTLAGDLDSPVLDMLTSLYYVRSQPLEIGHDISFDIINREARYPLLVKVLGKETVKTPAGKFNCWVVEPQFRGEGIFVAKGKSLKVWLTDDAYRMPVKMSVEVFIGSVSAELLEYQRN